MKKKYFLVHPVTGNETEAKLGGFYKVCIDSDIEIRIRLTRKAAKYLAKIGLLIEKEVEDEDLKKEAYIMNEIQRISKQVDELVKFVRNGKQED